MYPRWGETRNLLARNRRDMSSPTSFWINDDYGYPFSTRIIGFSRSFSRRFIYHLAARENIYTRYNRDSRPWKRAIILSIFRRISGPRVTLRVDDRSASLGREKKFKKRTSLRFSLSASVLSPRRNVTRRKINSTLCFTRPWRV